MLAHAVFAPVVRRAGVRLVMAVHDQLRGRHWLERLSRRLPPDMMLANSAFSAGYAEALFPGVPCQVVYYPLEFPPLTHRDAVRREVRETLGTPAGRVVIVQASRLERWKGQASHLAALVRLRAVPGWEAWFAGGVQKRNEKAFLAELRRTAERGGIADRVRFLGQRSDVNRLLVAADVFCQPNTGPEPFGIAYVEALAAGLPVVTSDFGGGAEIVTSRCGVLTPPGDDRAVAAALERLIRDDACRRAVSGPPGRTGPSGCATP